MHRSSLRRVVVLGLVLSLLAFAAPSLNPTGSDLGSSTPATAAVSGSIGSHLLVSPPEAAATGAAENGEVVDPTAGYSSEPAPMGIADFGVAPGPKAYTYGTTEFLANLSWSSIDLARDGDAEFTNQLNVVLQFDQGGVPYAYWIQDVAIMNSSTGLLEFENNIWNFSNPSYCLANSALSGNGTVYSLGGCEGYYAVGAYFQPGAAEYMSTPGHYSLLVRSYRSGSGAPEVAFEYNDGVTSYEVTYDNVVWPWATSVTTDNNFYVDGNATAPSGNFYDAEFDLGGPGGGSETEANALTDLHSQLLYWNGHNFEAPRATWNFGGDTGERIDNVQSFFSTGSGGIPVTTQLNGTARNATPQQAYSPTQVGVLSIDAPSIAAGTISVDGTVSNFVSDWANLTLVPGVYAVWVNSSSTHQALGSCSVVGGTTLRVTLPDGCAPELSTPTASPSSIDVGQTVAFETTLVAAGTGGDSFDWGSLSTDLGCAASTADVVACTPTEAGTYPVEVSVTDSSGQSNTSAVLEFTVDSDPEVSAPTATPTSSETGASVTFRATASEGSGGYSYVWTGLPTPCTSESTDAPNCTPSTAGSYSVSVEVTDSNHASATSSVLDFSVVAGPTIAPPSASPSGPIELGAEVNLTTSVSLGTPPYSISWMGLPTGCTSANATTIGCRPTVAGDYNVTASVVDAAGGSARSEPTEVTVLPSFVVATPTSSRPSVDVGENVTLTTAGASGGSGGYSYVWTGLPAGCSSSNSTSIACVPQAVGSYRVQVQATDSLGADADATVSLSVDPELAASEVELSRTNVDEDQSVLFSVVGVTGGSGVYSYLWGGLPSGCASGNASSITCVPGASGAFEVTATVHDTNGAAVLLTAKLAVDPLPTVGEPQVVGSSPTVGGALNLSVETTPGSGGLEYVWSGLPSGCPTENLSSISCIPTSDGEYSVTVTVTDSNGGSATSAALAMSVAGNHSPVELSDTDIELILAVAGFAAAVGVIVAVASRRRSPPRSRAP